MPADRLRGDAVAAGVRDDVRERVAALGERGVVPTLATVLMSDEDSDERFVKLKHEACEAVGVEGRDVRVNPTAPPERLHGAVERCSADDAVDAVFVQAPLPEHVPEMGVRTRLGPEKDVDGFHPETLGRLVAGDPTFVPATTAAVGRLLDAYGIPVVGREVVVVGRSSTIGRPLANHLLRRGEGGDATVTVCHSRTSDLAAHTRRADVLVTAAGVPGLVDGSMLSPGAVVVDVSANRRETDDGVEVVGDVAFESASEVASAVTPVPGGVGPVTLACLLENVVLAAERRA
ncbi:bifunctional 5,10-methylene-tetrahydrofolate dehydrogenase/5,10-methylene-tetrahydrofolate cyclohydrolase [Salinirubellus salinus]|uniref:Bifunctional protein FolD n=1 Tax=Salinirubellus salinus TaxID=1364945 RepID=A0A9E7R3I7_9EURY|nr:tetrahydrofolate dehydrogenase/cyclohydrolase catalytic domain-containing protein [Salinirubellus salinus]UWM54579.1 bifunctional 5,10-methylene-tetrahydrofolate dehydrogenase/5,10-methylene-tetrahydrofolate cyclohydrolase [Salinirubellus salinus]